MRSIRTAVELIKVGRKRTGMMGIKAISGPPDQPTLGTAAKFILSFEDGSVGVFNLERRRLEFTSQPAHSETIFDCRFKPSSPDTLATASYDGTVKIWDTRNMKCVLDLKGQEGVIYALSWCPGADDEYRLVSASSLGEVVLWNTRTGQPMATYKHHTKPIYRVKWNQLDSNLIASTSSDGTWYVWGNAGGLELWAAFLVDFD